MAIPQLLSTKGFCCCRKCIRE